ncbi:hypothetical protein OEW28_04130 [Defluviimonas sp. WL0002]|uniref:Uncharacterized protein n=1 Tax=Albidovulum marisflavi TaxID=2984159 RepID=A0ABT2Z9L6_9RHOB|nr:hypothetical protein [Defluviimonas sp. WL0002]MCV2867807.1 hypothetical protein [Defluviimonas sp. WL0002]
MASHAAEALQAALPQRIVTVVEWERHRIDWRRRQELALGKTVTITPENRFGS